jgi:DNA-binding transcriptional MerR regulator
MGEYKIKDIEVLTGVKAHTIRIWEKRYGIIAPSRTDTAIRMYSDEELTSLLKISILNKNGVKISKIALMNQFEIDNAILEFNTDETSFSDQLLIALVEMDEVLFTKTLNQLVQTEGLDVVFTEHLIPFLNKIGIMWIVGTINPAQEHFISNLIRQKLIAEIDKLPIPTFKERPILLFLPENEWHEIGLLFYQYILRFQGVNSVYLGQSLPVDSLLQCIDRYKPKALITSILSSLDKNGIVKYFNEIHSKDSSYSIYAGGYQIDLYASDLPKFVHRIVNTDVLKTI